MVTPIDRKDSARGIFENIIFLTINNLLSKLVAKTRISRILYIFYGRILPVPERYVREVSIKVIIPLNQIGVYETFKNWEEREPEVLDWIDGFEKDCIFFDVGASFGTETLYAALKKNGPRKIVAFDLSLDASVNLAYNINLNNITKVDQYYLALGEGLQLISFSEPTQYYFVKGREKYDNISYKTVSISMDQFIEMTGIFPDYIKIDVDGAEENIISGMTRTVQDRRLKSVAVEVTQYSEGAVAKFFEKAGFLIKYQRVIEKENRVKNMIFTRTGSK
jgi:FkbM family methyltransferase